MTLFALRLVALGAALALPAAVLASAPPGRAELESALRSNDPEQLAQLLKKLNQATGDASELSFQRGLIYLKREQYESAMASFALIPVSSAYYLDARNNMAAIYAAQGKFTEAKATLEESLKANQSLELLYKNLNNLKAHLASKNYASALQVLEPGKNSKLSLVVSTGAPAPEPQRSAKERKEALNAEAKPAAAASAASTESPAKTEATLPKPAPVASAAPVAKAPAAAAASAPTPPAPAPERTAAVKAADKPADKPQASSPAATQDAELTKAAVQALQDWAQAWEKKDIERYLKSYAPDFVPGDGKSHAQWAKERQAKILSKGQIKIQLKQVEATLVNKAFVKLRYRQHYQADHLKVSSDKTIDMKWIGQQWLITGERASEGARR